MQALVPMFRGASHLEVTAALRHFKPAKLDMDTVLMVEGDDDPSLVVVLEGELEIRCGDVDIAAARKGDVVGEMALFSGERRMASVSTAQPSKLLTLDIDGYNALRAAGNTVVFTLELNVIGQLVHRLRHMWGLLVSLETAAVLLPRPPGPKKGFQRLASLWTDDPVAPPAAAVDLPDLLASHPAFAGASEASLVEIAAAFTCRGVLPKRIVVEAGVEDGTMAMLVEGKLAGFLPKGPVRAVALPTPEPGTLLDLPSMYDHKRSAATWKTAGEATLAFLERDAWRALIESPEEAGSTFRVAVIRALSARFRHATARVLELEKGRRDQLRGELADFLGVDAEEMADSQFSHYGIGGHRT